MTLSIIYKQQCKEVTPNFDQFDSTSSSNRDECSISFQTLVKTFNIEYNRTETLLLEYPNAKLRELSVDDGEDEDLVIVSLNADGYFLCKLNKQYKLYPGKRVFMDPISDEEKCHFSKIDIEIAAILSDAVYYSDPILHINEKYSSYNCISTLTTHECGLKFASNAPSPYLLAISKSHTNEETLWVAFRGTTNANDVLTDLTILPMLTSSGLVHRGFSKRASEFPYDTLINEFNSTVTHRKRLIFTGHSLGGSVAHLCAILNLARRSFKEKPQIYSIAFGAPFIGNITVATDLIKSNFNDHFLTIINQSDLVPNLLNLVETGTRIQKTIASIAEPCSEITKTLLPVISLATGIPDKVIQTSVSILNSLIPMLKKLLVNKTTEYKPIGQYGFIRSLVPLDNVDNKHYEWTIKYKSNTIKMDYEKNEEKFVDVISKGLTELFGPSTTTITVSNITCHCMEKYISSLISCEIIDFQPLTRTQQPITEFQRFNPYIRKATAICSNTDIKITITGDRLDFLSLHEKMCVITSENFFQPSSTITVSEISRNKLVLMNNTLVPVGKRVTIGPRKYKLDTHFGKIDLMLELYDDNDNNNNNEQQITSTFQIFDTNFLMGTFLRSFFECLYSNNDFFLPNKNSSLHHFAKLVENRLPNKFQQFRSLLEKHHDLCQQMKKMNKPIAIDGKLYNDMSGLINDLYTALIELPEYTYTKSFLQNVKENPRKFLVCGISALVGIYLIFHVWLFNLADHQLFTDTSISTTLTQFGYAKLHLTFLGTVLSYRGFTDFSGNSFGRLIYHEHLAFLLNSMGSNSDRCANEKMLEVQLCDILAKKSIDFDDIDMKDRKNIEKIIKDKHLFDLNGVTHSERLTLYGTTIDSQIKAFEFLHDVYHICKLRRSMSAQYISFIGAHRAGKSSLLKSLWNIPVERGDYLDNRTQQMRIYTLYDDNSSNKVHLIDCPGVTDPVPTIAHLNQNYSVLSTFYVIVVKAGTDYDSAAKLIKELQASPLSSSTITSPSETSQRASNPTTTAQSTPADKYVPTDQQSMFDKSLL